MPIKCVKPAFPISFKQLIKNIYKCWIKYWYQKPNCILPTKQDIEEVEKGKIEIFSIKKGQSSFVNEYSTKPLWKKSNTLAASLAEEIFDTKNRNK